MASFSGCSDDGGVVYMYMHRQSVQYNDHIMFGVWLSVFVVFSESAV